MKPTINEKYYGIRVGNPRIHHCYLWVGEDGVVPKLYVDRSKAEEDAETFKPDTDAKVVRVRVTNY